MTSPPSNRATRAKVLIAAAVVLVAALAWLWTTPNLMGGAFRLGDDGAGADVRATTAGDAEAAGVRATAGLATWAGRHSLRYRNTMRAPSQLGPATAGMQLEGELVLSARRGDGWHVGRLVAGTLQVDEPLRDPMGLDGAIDPAAFGKTFALRVDEDGAIVELRHDAKASIGARNLVSTLLHALQIVRTARDATAGAWTLREPDNDGDIEAAYALSGDTLRKSWHAEELGAEQGGKGGMVTEGSAEFVLEGVGAATHVAAARHRLSVRADLGMGRAEARYEGEVEAELRRLGDLQAAWADGVDVAAMEVGLGDRTIRAPRPVRQVAEGATVHGMVAAASAATASKDNMARHQAREQLALLIAADPRHAQEVGRLLRADTPGVDRRTLIEALASSDSAAGKHELASAIGDASLDGELRADVATGTTFMPRPGAELIESLRAASEDAGGNRAATSALWALAAQAELQQRHDVGLAAALQSEILGRASKVLGGDAAQLAAIEQAHDSGKPLAPPPPEAADAPAADAPAAVPLAARPDKHVPAGQAMAWLDALGNVGGEAVFKHIRPWTMHPNHQVRMTALMALRAVQTSEARVLLVDRMARDPDGWVRRAAVMAAAYHPAAIFIDPIKRALKEDVHANVRLAAAYNLAVWAHESPTLMHAVREAAKREPKPFVRRAMEDLEPMLFRDRDDGVVTMEPVLPGGKHVPSIPEGVVPVERAVAKTAATAEGALVGKPIAHESAAKAGKDAP